MGSVSHHYVTIMRGWPVSDQWCLSFPCSMLVVFCSTFDMAFYQMSNNIQYHYQFLISYRYHIMLIRSLHFAGGMSVSSMILFFLTSKQKLLEWNCVLLVFCVLTVLNLPHPNI